jgi:hypothetical protein
MKPEGFNGVNDGYYDNAWAWNARMLLYTNVGKFSMYSGSNVDFSARDTNTHCFVSTYGSTGSFRIDSGAEVLCDTGSHNITSLRLGSVFDNSSNGNFRFYSMLIYNRDLTTEEEDAIRSWLVSKSEVTLGA